MRKGFGLIEFMIVITVFGIATAVITASFLTFERNQRLKSAASALKNDIRLVQNKALAGDKGPAAECPEASRLVGWYVKVDTTDINLGDSNYMIAGDCKDSSGNETSFNEKPVALPRGIIFPPTSVSILYQPLTNTVTFHTGSVTPPFFLSGNFKSQIGAGSSLTIELVLESDSLKKYQVIVQSSGEVSEQK